MRKLLGLVLVAATLWSGYWFVGSRSSKQAVVTWMEDRRADGWQVEYSDLAMRGFPNRFDLTFTDLILTDPETGVSWSAPMFQLLSLSYKPNHLIAVWPGEQLYATPEQKITIKTDEMRASLVIKPSVNLQLNRSNLVMKNARFVSTKGWVSSFDDMTAAIRETDGKEMTYDIAFQSKTLTPSDDLRQFLDQGGTLPDQIEGVLLDAEVAFARPLDLRVIEENRPDITRLVIKQARGTWGQLELRAKGEVDVDHAGIPTGSIAVNARNWREMLQLAIQAGAIDPDAATAAELGLSLLASASGNSNSLDAPLGFRDGLIFLGPFPIGEAPKINLR